MRDWWRFSVLGCVVMAVAASAGCGRNAEARGDVLADWPMKLASLERIVAQAEKTALKQMDMTGAAAATAMLADLRVRELCRRELAGLEGDALIAAQAEWRDWRALREVEAQCVGEEFKGGSLEPMQALYGHAHASNKRLKSRAPALDGVGSGGPPSGQR